VKNHPFQILDPSPWPFLTSCVVLVLGIGSVLAFKGITVSVLLIGFAGLLTVLYGWFSDMFDESLEYTEKVKYGLKCGFLTFMLSEFAVFAGLVGGFIYAVSSKYGKVGPMNIPYLNTLMLMLSGTTLTWAHYCIDVKDKKHFNLAMMFTISLGILFLILQYFEYMHVPFSIKENIYSSNFFLITGFHGLHVCFGIIFLLVVWRKSYKNPSPSIGFDTAAWYWHFVDIVWIVVFLCIYLWAYFCL
jgi:cytochrome c oxidase subunit III